MPIVAKIPLQTRVTAQKLYLQGCDVKDIASTLGLNPRTVRQWATREKWTDQRTQLSLSVAKTVGIDAKTAQHLSAAAAERHIARVEQIKEAELDRFSQLNPTKSSDLRERAEALSRLNDIGRLNVGLTSDAGSKSQTFNFNLGAVQTPEKIIDIESLTEGRLAPPAGRE